MRNTKKLTVLIIALAVVAVAASVSSVVAYMVKRTQQLDNQFIPAQVQCAVKEEFEDNTKTSVKVQNTGNIEAYVRLRIVTYWQDSKGNVVGMTAPDIKFAGNGNGEWKYDTNNWIYDEDEKTFYYKTPIASEAVTEELFADGFEGIELEVKTVVFNKENYIYHPVITFVAEAIQSQPTEAVTKWDVTLDANGNINGLK